MTDRVRISQKKTGRLAGVLVACLVSFAAGVRAQDPQTSHGALGGPPAVVITQVQSLGASAKGRQFQIRWTVQSPNGTTILGYTVRLEIKFTQNLRQTAVVSAAPEPTSARPFFPDAPADAIPISFNAIIETQFKTPETNSITTIRDLTFQEGGIATAPVVSGGPLPPDKPVAQIFRVTHLTPSTNIPDRYRVEWNAQAAQGITIDRFGLSGEVKYGFKQTPENPVPPQTRQTTQSIGFGSTRQGDLEVKDPPQIGTPKPLSIRVILNTNFTALVTRTLQSQKQGNF
jgi:hypothetical protein